MKNLSVAMATYVNFLNCETGQKFAYLKIQHALLTVGPYTSYVHCIYTFDEGNWLKKNPNLYILNNLAINFQMKSWDMLKWKYVTKYNDSSLKTRQNFFQHIYGKRDILKYAGTECKVRNLSSRGWRWLSDGDLPIYLPIDPSVLFRFLVFS